MTLRNVSASQVSAFKMCQRFWYFGWIERLRAPKTAAQQRGTDIHAEVEHYLTTGEIRDSAYDVVDDETGEIVARLNYRPYVEALAPYLPPARHPELVVEHEFSLDLAPRGVPVPWYGVVDLGFSGSGWPKLSELSALFQFSGSRWPALTLGDVKSISDMRYARKPEELRRDTQLCSYAAWAIDEGHRGALALGHYYVQTEKRRVSKKIKVLPRFVEVSTDEVLAQFNSDVDIVREMVVAGSASSAHDVAPTGAATRLCDKMFGRPCPHRARCGFDLQIKKGILTMGFMDKFKSGKNGDAHQPSPAAALPAPVPQVAPSGGFMAKFRAAGAKVPAAAQAVAPAPAAIPTGILPPDAPPRETAATAATPAAVASPPETGKRGRPKKAAAREGLSLYLGCRPVKGHDVDGVVLFEDFIAPVIAELNEYVRAEKNVSHYRFLDFSEEKALFALAVADKLPALGSASLVVLNPQSAEWRDAMTAIIPHAVGIVE